MHRFRRVNPLALAVLVTLAEGPRHPYEVAQTLKQRHHDKSIRLNFGSLYSVVASLEKAGLIETAGTERDSRRPERTVYAVTADGREEAADWLGDLLATPVREYLQFEAALTMMAAVSPERAEELLRQRILSIEADLAAQTARHELLRTRYGIPRLFLIEAEYRRALVHAEATFVRELVAELAAGNFDQIDAWRSYTRDADPSGFALSGHPPVPLADI